MDCNCEAKSGIGIVKPMVMDSAHWISVVLASINIKRCRTSQSRKRVKKFDECTMLASYIAILVVILL